MYPHFTRIETGAQEAATPCTPLSQSALDVHERFWNNSHAWGAIESRAATTAAATAFTFRSMGSKSRSTEQRPELFSSQDGRSSDGSPSTMRSCTRASLFSDFPEERSRIMRSQVRCEYSNWDVYFWGCTSKASRV